MTSDGDSGLTSARRRCRKLALRLDVRELGCARTPSRLVCTAEAAEQIASTTAGPVIALKDDSYRLKTAT